MLELRQLTKRYGEATVLADVSLELERGEILALCGENGAGKSTLVSIVAGAIAHGQYDGAVLLDGHELRLTGPAQAEQAGMALLPQELLLFPELSVAENVMAARLPVRGGLLDPSQMRERAAQLLRSVGVNGDVTMPVGRLETSAQQLVCIARALASDPRVLILDEPTAALPRAAAENLFAVLRELAAGGRSVLYVSHHLSELEGLAHRAAVLRNGRLVMAPRPTPPVPEIVQAMLGETLADERQPRGRAARRRGAQAALRVDVEYLRGRERTALRGVSFEVAPGEIVGVAGLTGSGREELMRLCVGDHTGRAQYWIEVAGQAWRNWSPRMARRRGVFFLGEDRRAQGVLALADVAANVLLGSEDYGSVAGMRRPRSERDGVASAVSRARVQVHDRGKLVGLMSGGTQQRVLFARALLQRSQLMILCEPTRGIDVGARLAVHHLIRELAEEGRSVLLSSADHAELAALCDRVLVLVRGALTRQLDSAEITEAAITHAVTARRDAPEQGRGPSKPDARERAPARDQRATHPSNEEEGSNE